MNAFNNEKYLKLQEKEILKRIEKYNKVYFEFGGKLFNDLHCSRVFPGYDSCNKVNLLGRLKRDIEIILCICALDIEKKKYRSDLNISYENDIFRFIKKFNEMGIFVNSVVITRYNNQEQVDKFVKKLETNNIAYHLHKYTKGYPTDIDLIVSDEGYGANSYIKTTKPLVVVTSPGPGGGKLATCLSQLYHEYKLGNSASYMKFETFPVWNLPLNHPVNVAYEASTVDLNDKNMIDPFHLEAYNKVTVNYNRDIEVYPILREILKRITGKEIYKSPTDMGVNMIGYCIDDEELVIKAAKEEIIRRYYKYLELFKKGLISEDYSDRVKILMNQLNIDSSYRPVIKESLDKYKKCKSLSIAIRLKNNQIITGRDTKIMSASASVVLNSIKYLSNIPDDLGLLSDEILMPMLNLKRELYGEEHSLLSLHDVLQGLSICSATNPIIKNVMNNISSLSGCDAHASHYIPENDNNTMRLLNIYLTFEPIFYNKEI